MPDQLSNQQLLAAYEKLYYFELDRKEKLFTRLPILLALYSVLLGVLASYLSNLPHGKPYLLIIFYGVAAGQLCFLGWSIFYTYKFLYSDEYDYILPDTPDLSSVIVIDLFDEDDSDKEDIVPILIGKYSDSVVQNFNINKTRNADFFKATNLIIIALGFAFVGAFPYFTLREESKSSVQRVMIDNPLKVNVMPHTTIQQKPQQPDSKSEGNEQGAQRVKRDATGLGVYRLKDRHTSAESKAKGEWVRRK